MRSSTFVAPTSCTVLRRRRRRSAFVICRPYAAQDIAKRFNVVIARVTARDAGNYNLFLIRQIRAQFKSQKPAIFCGFNNDLIWSYFYVGHFFNLPAEFIAGRGVGFSANSFARYPRITFLYASIFLRASANSDVSRSTSASSSISRPTAKFRRKTIPITPKTKERRLQSARTKDRRSRSPIRSCGKICRWPWTPLLS